MRRNKREGYCITFVPNIFTINYANDRVNQFEIKLFDYIFKFSCLIAAMIPKDQGTK